jgi:hypothetical protein
MVVLRLKCGTILGRQQLQASRVGVVGDVGSLDGQGDRVGLDLGVIIVDVRLLAGPSGDGVDGGGDLWAEGILDVFKGDVGDAGDAGVLDDIVQPRDDGLLGGGLTRYPATRSGCSMYGRSALSTCMW